MPKFDFDEFKKWCTDNKAVPMVVIYAKESSGGGTDLDFLTTEVFDQADDTLKADTVATVGKVYENMK